MRRLRALALTGAVLLGSSFPAITQADGAPASTYIVSLRPLAGLSADFAAVQSRLLGFTVLDTYQYALSGFSATMKTLSSTPGTLSTQRGLTRERGARANGSFRGRLRGRATASTRAFRAFARGTWRARFDVVADPVSGKSTASGVALVSGRRGGGRLCLGYRLKVTVRGRKITTSGTFETLGGSGPARRLVARGKFSETLGSAAAFTLRGTGAPGRPGGRGLPASCRRLR